MLFNRYVRRAVTVAALGAATAALAGIPAHAAEGTWSVISSSRCQAKEIVRLQPVNGTLHDFMLVDPTINVPTCWFGIWDNNRGAWAYSNESGAESPPIFDGPGQSLKVEVWTWNGSAWVDPKDGPSN
jgi:uncharacterized membrane protein